MIRELNRRIKDSLRPIRLGFGKKIWDRKIGATSPKLLDIIRENKINSVLFFRYDGKIGDMIVNTMIFRELKKEFPNLKIGVVARGAARDIITNSPWVNEIYNYDQKPLKIIELAKRINGEYDLLVDFSEFIRVNEMMFINMCRCPFNLGLDKGDWNLFNLNVTPEKDFLYTDHVTKRYGAYLTRLGVKEYSTDYDIFIDETRDSNAKEYYEELHEMYPSGKKFIILNPYGASKHKNFNSETIHWLGEILSKKEMTIIFIYSPDKEEETKELYKSLKSKHLNVVFPPGIKSILDSAALIKYSDGVITPDTSIIHVASAFKKPVVGVYPPNGGTYGVDHLVWSPFNTKYAFVFCKEQETKEVKFNINTFSKEDMLEKIKEVLGG